MKIFSPDTPSNGNKAIVKITIPSPPNHWRKERHNNILLGIFSISVRIVAPVVVTPETDSKRAFEYPLNAPDRLYYVSKNAIDTSGLIRIYDIEEKDESPSLTQRFIDKARGQTKGVKVGGVSNTLINFGKCCNPIPGDSMVGFVTRGRGMTVHRANCYNLPISNEESDRLVPVEWEVSRSDLFNVHLKVVGQDRKGLLKDMTENISKLNINITSVDIKVKDTVATAKIIVQVSNLKQLDRVLRKVAEVKSIDTVSRIQN